jgi:xanthine dehydrogenase YagS FAD-binding subunit
MRLEVIRPHLVVDITALPLTSIEVRGDSITIGALATNTEVAYHDDVARKFPALAEALRSGASPQIRNMATVGGNLLQRTRCPYFRDVATACNKRNPGSGCAALTGGYTRSHAVLGNSTKCIATHPSDMCVALVALDAIAHVRGPAGERMIAIEQLHTLPGDHPEIESALRPGELVTHVELPARQFAAHSRYVKLRDRASFAFALASAAAALAIDRNEIVEARLALGGVATKPWRAHEAEATLIGKRLSLDTFERAAKIALADAQPQTDNAFKIELAKRAIVRALARAGGLA